MLLFKAQFQFDSIKNSFIHWLQSDLMNMKMVDAYSYLCWMRTRRLHIENMKWMGLLYVMNTIFNDVYPTIFDILFLAIVDIVVVVVIASTPSRRDIISIDCHLNSNNSIMTTSSIKMELRPRSMSMKASHCGYKDFSSSYNFIMRFIKRIHTDVANSFIDIDLHSKSCGNGTLARIHNCRKLKWRQTDWIDKNEWCRIQRLRICSRTYWIWTEYK